MIQIHTMTIFSALAALTVSAPFAIAYVNSPVIAQPLFLSQKLTAVQLYNQGVDKLNAGDFQGAIANFTEALKLNDRDEIGRAHV